MNRRVGSIDNRALPIRAPVETVCNPELVANAGLIKASFKFPQTVTSISVVG